MYILVVYVYLYCHSLLHNRHHHKGNNQPLLQHWPLLLQVALSQYSAKCENLMQKMFRIDRFFDAKDGESVLNHEDTHQKFLNLWSGKPKIEVR